MTVPKLEYYGLFFYFPKTRKDFQSRMSLINFIKSWISSIESIRSFKLTMKTRTISLDSKNVSINFSASEIFGFYVASQEEKDVDSANLITNEVLEKFNEGVFPDEKAQIRVVAAAHFKLPQKSNLFSKLIKTSFLKDLDCPLESVNPTTVDLTCTEKETKQRLRFSLNKSESENTLDLSIDRLYQNKLPPNIMSELISLARMRANAFTKTVIEES